jgi:DNA repair exonuclease SbcCD nuclease subunit
MNINANKIGLFSDIHIGLHQDSETWHEITLNFAKWASKKFEDNGISNIILAGDVFHNRFFLPLKTIHTSKKFFEYFKDFNIFILTGNHDCLEKNTSKVHSIELLSEWKNITVVDKNPEILNVNHNKKISLIPWGTSVEDFPKCDICVGHFDIVSFYHNNYSLCKKGFSTDELFNYSNIIVSGHFHKKQIREYAKGKIIYMGSPYQHNFGDVNDQRGIHIYDVNLDEFTFIENNVSPVHFKIKLSQILNKEITLKDLKKNVHNNFIKIVIDQDINKASISALITKIKNLAPISLNVEYNYKKEFTQTDQSKEQNEINDISNISLEIEKYIDIVDIQHKEDVKTYVLDVYNSLQ